MIMARKRGWKESSNFFCSFPFRPDIIQKKRAQNDTACPCCGEGKIGHGQL